MKGEKLIVPDWVSAEDEMSSVIFSVEAKNDLEQIVKRRKMAPLYNQHNLQDVFEAIREVLAQDPRAVKRRGTIDESPDPYKITFCSCEISFIVPDGGIVEIVGISEMNMNESVFVDGIPLAHKGTAVYIT